MLEIQIDVSGDDVLERGYCIVAAKSDFKSYFGFKFDEKLVRALKNNYETGKYHYGRSKTGKIYFKIRVYCIVVSILVKSIMKENNAKEAGLYICRDFDGHKEDIELNLKSLLRDVKIARLMYDTLPKESAADILAYLLNKSKRIKGKRFDRKRIIIISLADIEKHIK